MSDIGVKQAQSKESALARAVVYRVLARCFAYPDKELLELFHSARLEEFLQSWRYLGLGSSENIAEAANWLAKWPSGEYALFELEKEYTRLFITAFPRVIAPPYSSVYLDRERLVWGGSTAEVVRLYEAAGLGMNQDFHDIPDHIAAELEFASYLIQEQVKGEQGSAPGGQAWSSIEQRLLVGHLFRWVPPFLGRVIGCSVVAFYREIAHLAREFVEWDAARY